MNRLTAPCRHAKTDWSPGSDGSGLGSHRLSTRDSPSLPLFLFLTPSFCSFASFPRLFALLLSPAPLPSPDSLPSLSRLTHLESVSGNDGALIQMLFERRRGGRAAAVAIITQDHLCASACSPVCTAQTVSLNEISGAVIETSTFLT